MHDEVEVNDSSRKKREMRRRTDGGYTNARIVTRGLPLGDARQDVKITTKGELDLTSHIPAQQLDRLRSRHGQGFATGMSAGRA